MKKLISSLYKWLPGSLQDMLITSYGYKLKGQRYGSEYEKWFNYYKDKHDTDIEKALSEQFELLRGFIRFASEKSPFYQKLYKDVSIEDIKSLDDLKGLPVVSKEMLRTNMGEVHTIEEKQAVVSFTGGTTGKSLKVLLTPSDFQQRMAYLDAFKFKVGVDIRKAKKATFSGRNLIYRKNSRRFWRNNYAYRQRLYSTFHITEESLPKYIKNLNAYKPEVINGFVSAIYEIAEYINRKQIKLAFKPQAIFTTSETLLDHHRATIEKAFGSKIYNQYASAEGAPFITECRYGNLHYNLDTGVIESNEQQEMIVTSFTTHGTPLIRYNIGDLIEWKDGACECGSCHPLVASIQGRKVDFLYGSEGNKISLSHLADVIKGIPNSVTKMQFVQRSRDEIKVLFEVDDELFEANQLTSMMEEMKYRFGKSMNIEMERVDHIPKEPSGKYALIKNLIV